MGRGSSKAGGGGGGTVQQALNPNKPFSPTDLTTWGVGTELKWKDEDIIAVDNKVGSKSYNQTGVVTEVHPDHLVVTTDMGVRNWVELDATKYRATSKGNAIPTSQVKVSMSGNAPTAWDNYGFKIGNKIVWFSGEFTRAKDYAVKYAAAQGIKNIILQKK